MDTGVDSVQESGAKGAALHEGPAAEAHDELVTVAWVRVAACVSTLTQVLLGAGTGAACVGV